MKILFFGTPDFAVTVLEAVVAAGHEVVGVVTQPDRVRGRGGRVLPSPVKGRAQKLGLPVYEPGKRALGELIPVAAKADVGVVVAYGRILPASLLQAPPFGFINVHASLLPRYRGAAPIQRAIMAGESLTGVTIMQMSPEMDAGDILWQTSVPILPEDDASSLGAKLAKTGAAGLLEVLEGLSRGRVVGVPQDRAAATFAPKLSPAEEAIDWAREARVVWNHIRALAPEPGGYTFWQGKRLKILAARLASEGGPAGPPGTVVAVAKPEGIVVACATGSVMLTRVQLEGRKAMSAIDFANGYRLSAGDRFDIAVSGEGGAKA